MRLDGVKELQQFFSQLGPVVANVYAPQGVREAAEQIADRARQNIISHGNVRSGELLKSIRVIDSPSNTPGGAQFNVFVGSTRYNANWIEFGTLPRVQRKTGRYTGVTPASPFLRPAVDDLRPVAIKTIVGKIAGGIATLARSIFACRFRGR